MVDFSAPGNYAIDSELESQDGDVGICEKTNLNVTLMTFSFKKKKKGHTGVKVCRF